MAHLKISLENKFDKSVSLAHQLYLFFFVFLKLGVCATITKPRVYVYTYYCDCVRVDFSFCIHIKTVTGNVANNIYAES